MTRPRTKTFTVIYAEDVPYYASGEIKARTLAAAIKRAKSDDTDTCWNHEPDRDHSTCKRIVRIEDEDGNVLAEDIPLDNFHLRDGGDTDRRLCEAAPALRDALRQIAATPLWGEAIADPDLRAEYVRIGEYDAIDGFNPSSDTESSYLTDAVQTARAALEALTLSHKEPP